jgi:hypothetical protein
MIFLFLFFFGNSFFFNNLNVLTFISMLLVYSILEILLMIIVLG